MSAQKKLTKPNSFHLVKNQDQEFWQKLDYEFFSNFTSEHTRKSYRNDIKQFFLFLREQNFSLKDLNDIERFHIVAYRNSMEEKKLAPKSINRKLSSISSYFDFLAEKNLLQFNPCQSVKRPRQEVQTPTNDLSDEQVYCLLETIDPNSQSGPLHRAILYVLFSTGIRKSELIYLKGKDYKKIKGHKVIDIKAKGGKQLTKVLHPICAKMVDEYLAWMKKQGREVGDNDWLFQPTKNPTQKKSLSELNKPMRPSSIDYILQTYSKKAGIDSRISVHSARATYIGSALESGQSLWKVAQDVGHSSVKTTEEYNKRRRKMEESPAYDLGYFKKSS